MSHRSNSFTRRQFLNRASLSAGALFAAQTPLFSTLKPSFAAVPKGIPTVTGLVDPGSIGVTLMHEHLLFFNGATPTDPGFQPIPDDLREESVSFVVKNLNDAARVGINTIVDVGPYRPIDLYAQIAKRTPVKIIVSTGFYRESTRPPWFVNMNDEGKMVEYMLREIQEGIGDSKIRAGIIKVAQEKSPMSDWEKKVFHAAATVQKQTGIHIATHTGNAVEQFNLLTRSGADPKSLYFSHVDVGRKGQVGDLIKLLQAGCYLEVDTFGQSFYTPESLLVSFIRSVCDAGYANKLFISIDSNWHWANGEKKFEGSEAPYMEPTAANRTFAYMMTDAVPMLLKNGFSMNEIRTFLVDNPRNFFSGYA
jgi:phosphotriesterase-related protein